MPKFLYERSRVSFLPLHGRINIADAYTAGVLDYLIEALEKWREEKDGIKASGKKRIAGYSRA